MVIKLRMRVDNVNVEKRTETNGNQQKQHENNKNIRNDGVQAEHESKYGK